MEGQSVVGKGLCIRIGTYNLRLSSRDSGENKWELRRPRIVQSIKDNNFDVFGVQECDSQLQCCLEEDLGKDYVFSFFSPYNKNGNGDKANGIVVKKNIFEISDWHFFWAADNPEIMSSGDTGKRVSYNRGGCCAVITHKATGVRFFVMETHACLHPTPNATYADVYIKMERRYNAGGIPSVFVGDMNATESAEASEKYRTWWKDVFLSVDKNQIKGPKGTFNGFDLTKDMDTARRIDFIYVRGGIKPLNYQCNPMKYNGHYASDHLPVVSDMVIYEDKSVKK
jgi:endonuclease/exonuclease/phosphatase family metal-dependent hydrolase